MATGPADPGGTTTGRGSRPTIPLSVIAKPAGAACNLDCEYCYFLSKDLLHDAPRQLMSEETARTYVRRFLDASPDGEVTMLWQGGEPTLRGLGFFTQVIAMCEQYRRPSQQVSQAIQTNATLIDERWAAFLAEHDVLVGVSVDGPPAYHDAYRRNRGGRGTYDLVLRGWRHLQDAGVRCNVLCTVNAVNEHHGTEVYRHLRDELGARHIQLIPVVERVTRQNLPRAEAGWGGHGGRRLLYRQEGTLTTSRSVSPGGYGDFLTEVFEEWVNGDVGTVYVRDIDGALSALYGVPTSCVHAPECGHNLEIEHNGDVYACDHWVEPDWRLGQIADSTFADLTSTDTMRRFAAKKSRELPATCRQCPVLPLCWGGCPKDRLVTDPGEQHPRSHLCEGYRSFFTHILPDLRSMAWLIDHGRAPAEINDPRARAFLRERLAVPAGR